MTPVTLFGINQVKDQQVQAALREIQRASQAGTAAPEDTGTSGHKIPFLDGANTWTATQTIAGLRSTSPSAGIGYGVGAGGTQTQGANKSTGVLLDKISGAITMNAALLAAATSVGFTFTNAQIAATDVVMVSIKSGATPDSYTVMVDAVAAGSCRISLRNYTAGGLSEAVVLNFVVIKGAAS